MDDGRLFPQNAKQYRVYCCGYTQVFETVALPDGARREDLKCSLCNHAHAAVHCDDGQPVLLLEVEAKLSGDETIGELRKLKATTFESFRFRPAFSRFAARSIRLHYDKQFGIEAPELETDVEQLQRQMSRVELLAVQSLLRGSPYRGHRVMAFGPRHGDMVPYGGQLSSRATSLMLVIFY